MNHARRKQRLKHGGGRDKLSLEDAEIAMEAPSEEMMALDEALTKLERTDKQKADLVKLRYFAGLTLEQAADILGLSRSMAKRHWTYARAWLYRQITTGN